MQFTDPLALEQFLAPAGGEVSIRPAVGSHFRADINIRMLPRVGLFTLEADSISIQKESQQEFYGFNIPLGVPFTVSEPGYDRIFNGNNMYMLSPDRPTNLQCRNKYHSMMCHFYVDSLQVYRERILQETTTDHIFLDQHVSLLSATGSRLFRSVAKAWAALGTDDSSVSEIARQEIEDDLLASFMSLAEEQQAIDREVLSPANFALKRTEDYICANLDKAITRDELADTAGVSIRSLNRAFEKRYGAGPMTFVRQRRLDACYARLLGSEPEETTVTNVATSYGFCHSGKFAMAYKKAFGELPSASLLK